MASIINGKGRRQGNGRRKTGTHEIEDALSRHVSFSKRRQGLMKKTYELSVLTGAEVALIVYSRGEKVYSFGSPDVDHVVDKYLTGNNPPMHYMQPLMESMQKERVAKKNAELRTSEDQQELEEKRSKELEKVLLEMKNKYGLRVIGQNISQPKQSMLVMNKLKQSVLEMKKLKADSQREMNVQATIEQQNKHDGQVLINYSGKMAATTGLNNNEPSQGIRNDGTCWGGFPPYQVGLTGNGGNGSGGFPPYQVGLTGYGCNGLGGYLPYQVGLTGYGSGAKKHSWFFNGYGGCGSGHSGSGVVVGGFRVADSDNSQINGGFFNSYGISDSSNVRLVSGGPSVFCESGEVFFNDRLSCFGSGEKFAAGKRSAIVDHSYPNIEVAGSSGVVGETADLIAK